MTLVKKLTKIGNSWGLILSTDILKMIGMEPEGECEIEIEKKGAFIRPHKKTDPLEEKVTKAMARFIRKYRVDLKKLA